MNYDRYINREYGLGKDFCPSDLVETHSQYKDHVKIRFQVFEAWKQLKEALIPLGVELEIESGYRSYDYQEKVRKECIKEKGIDHAYKYIAKPGHSEHQSGLAIDYCLKEQDHYRIEFDIPEEVSKIVEDIAVLYGFILRYPKGKETVTGYGYEPWHLRYVGQELATYLYKKQITLDEYEKEKESKK